MKKLLFCIFLTIAINANALVNECNPAEQRKATMIAAGIGFVLGASIGAIVVATMPVGEVGGPMAITYFPGTPAMGAWITKSVLPLTLIPGGLTGLLFAILVHEGFSEKCAEYLAKTVSLNKEGVKK